jgi:hypothetical protein
MKGEERHGCGEGEEKGLTSFLFSIFGLLFLTIHKQMDFFLSSFVLPSEQAPFTLNSLDYYRESEEED